MGKESFLHLVQAKLDEYNAQQREALYAISPDILELIDFPAELLKGGKRLRASFCETAWEAFADFSREERVLANEVRGVVSIAAALEMFHAAALVHDDLLDQSDTRRGAPAIHRRFESLHRSRGFGGDAVRFGMAGSVLVGDLMLSWSSELFGQGMVVASTPTVEANCRAEFGQMRFEVMAGQYLDVLEENAAPLRDVSEIVARANAVMLYKTAKYSLEAPVLIGAAFGGADAAHRKQLSDFAIPLGLAFQLRDDVLGVFGNPETTGKPAGDDLREGKRTVLVGLTLEALPRSVAGVFEGLLGDRELESEQITFMQEAIQDSGALQKTEQLIEEYSNKSLEALERLQIPEASRQRFQHLADAVINRNK